MFFGVINAGNIFGTLIALAFIAVWLFYPKLCGNKAFRILLRVLGTVFVLCLIYAAVLSLNMLKAASKAPPQDLNDAVVIVLGSKTVGDKPDAMLKNRLDKALDYLIENKDLKCVVAGGLNYKSGYSEAYVMQKYLTEHGINANRIIMEDESENTYENITFSAVHIRELNLPDTVIIVSDGFHLWRAVMTAEEYGFETYTLTCGTSMAVFPTYWVRELFALTRDLIFRAF